VVRIVNSDAHFSRKPFKNPTPPLLKYSSIFVVTLFDNWRRMRSKPYQASACHENKGAEIP
jgi:hypothetical protein